LLGEKAEAITLRVYQVRALGAWKSAGSYGCLVLPTGTGKTYIGLEAIREELASGGKCCVIVPTIALAHQWSEKISKALRVHPALFYGEIKEVSRVTIVVVNSAYRNLHLLREFSLVVIDEAHHLSAPRWSEIIANVRGKKVLGLTATPERCPLPIVFHMSISEARSYGAVVSVAIKPVYVRLTKDEWSDYLDIEEKIRKVVLAMENAKLRHDIEEVLRLEKQLQILANIRKQITGLAEAKFKALVDIAQRHPNEKVLVFTECIESAERARKALIQAGISAMCYHSGLSRNLRRTVLSLWGRTFKVLVAVRCLDEGIDVPECSVGVIITSGKTIRQLTQRLGRVLRPHQGKERAIMYVIVAEGTFEHDIFTRLLRLTH
jgi:superfamily II DNA or RNA helicase